MLHVVTNDLFFTNKMIYFFTNKIHNLYSYLKVIGVHSAMHLMQTNDCQSYLEKKRRLPLNPANRAGVCMCMCLCL